MGRRGDKKHLKRLAAPKHWMLDKLSGVWAPRPCPGPHKLRECLPLVLILRNRLKYALTGIEVRQILMQKKVLVDHKIRLNPKYPAGFMDVVTIKQTDQNFRLLYDTKGRFTLVKVDNQKAQWKLCRVVRVSTGKGGIANLVTHDGRTIRFPDPDIKVNDTIKFNIKTGEIEAYYKFDSGATVMIVNGRNRGRVGTIRKIEKHPGSYNLAHVVDATGHVFATRVNNVFVIGADEAEVTLPKGQGVQRDIIEERQDRLRRRRK